MKSVIYRPSWQKLRVSFLAGNHSMGGFTTEAGTQDNLQRLDNYIADANPETDIAQYVFEECTRMKWVPAEEWAVRVYRGLNLLNATRMGYSGQGLANSPMDMAVRQYRDYIQESYDGSLVVKLDARWDWDVIQFELEELWRRENFWFLKIYADLSRRRKVGGRRREAAVGDVDDVENTRPELLKFLRFMDAINRRPSV